MVAVHDVVEAGLHRRVHLTVAAGVDGDLHPELMCEIGTHLQLVVGERLEVTERAVGQFDQIHPGLLLPADLVDHLVFGVGQLAGAGVRVTGGIREPVRQAVAGGQIPSGTGHPGPVHDALLDALA